MKLSFSKGLIAAAALAVLFACSDSTTAAPPQDKEYVGFVVTGDCWWLKADNNYLIYDNNIVTDTQGNQVGIFDPATGVVSDLNGNVLVENVNTSELQVLTPDMVNDANEENPDVPGNTSSESQNQGNGQVPGGFSSSSAVRSSAAGSTGPTESGTVDASGYPVMNYEKLTDGSANKGWGSRYWDACKPHCALRENVDTTANPFRIARNCDINGKEIPAFTLSPNVNQWWSGYEGTKSACEPGGDAFACTDMAPVKVNDTLSYAFVATSLSNAQCGQCFQLQFNGGGHSGDKPSHKALAGKTLVVLASNTGGDVGIGQFDIMIPGGGVGLFDALSRQLGVSKESMGEQYGGLLTTCQKVDLNNNYDLPASSYKDCVRKKCENIFASNENLLKGCLWFADWFEAADNPTYLYKPVECPKYLMDKYLSTINTSKDTNIKPGSY